MRTERVGKRDGWDGLGEGARMGRVARAVRGLIEAGKGGARQ